MCCIQLVDAKFDTMNKDVGRQTLSHVEKAADQYSSRKHHKTIMAVLNKVVLNNIVQQQKRAAALEMNNARGCYDRIVYSIVVLVLMSFGWPEK